MPEKPSAGYVHDLLFYSSDDELLEVVAPFVAGALDRDESVVLAIPERHSAAITEAVNHDARVRTAPRVGTYGHPGDAIALAEQQLRLGRAAGAGPIRRVGEPDFGDAGAQSVWWAPFESVINEALAPYPMWNLCVYDTRRHPEQVLRFAERSHPYLVTPSGRTANSHYVEPSEFLRELPVMGPDPLEQTAPALHTDDVNNLAVLRTRIHSTALAGTAIPKRNVAEFVYALNEVVTNALVHGTGPVEVRLWTAPERLVCTVTDRGAGFDDPLAGYVPFHGDRIEPGHGLWLARRCCDFVEATHTPEGFCVRLISTG